MRRPTWIALFAASVIPLASPSWGEMHPLLDGARSEIIELNFSAAHLLLDPLDPSDAPSALERGRLALYEGDYDRAVELLSRNDIAKTDAGAELLGIALGCARATAGAVRVSDEARGIVVRFQDEDDRPLAPYIFEVVEAARATLATDLGTEVPRPLRIEMVRDLFTLSAMTGLPEQAAQNTGTVAVAKWGRITIISPRAVAHGYPWADTMVHEMAHLWQSRASLDRAPLWLQEGVAKREESRWRPSRLLDDTPPVDIVSSVGLKKGLFRPLDKLGASIALLPDAEQAAVAFAEVESFVRFFVDAAGPVALPKLLAELRTTDQVTDAVARSSGAPFDDWQKRWLAHLSTLTASIPSGSPLGARSATDGSVRRQFSIGELLRRRGHASSAAHVFEKAQRLAPSDPLIRERLASALLARSTERADSGERVDAGASAGGRSPRPPVEAGKWVERIEDVRTEVGAWYALHGWFLQEQGKNEAARDAFRLAIHLSPLHPLAACDGKRPPDLPSDEISQALCKAARAHVATLTDPSAKPYD